MSSDSGELHIVLPGLFDPPPDIDPERLPRLPALEFLLARSWRRQGPGEGLDATLCALFGVKESPQGNLPTAAFARLAQGGAPDDACWLHADPVFLRPDQDRVLLFDAAVLALTLDEAAEFASLFNNHFSEDGLMLEVRTPEHWYLRSREMPDVRFHTLAEVTGRTLAPFLPEGAEARWWRSLLNETQMLFHHAGINQRRTRNGQPPVGGLWLHGASRLAHVPEVRWKRVVAASPVARGLALQGGIETHTDVGALSMLHRGSTLVVREELYRAALEVNAESWMQALNRQEHYFERILDVMSKASTPLNLYPCDGSCWVYDRRSKRRFWRRRRSLSHYLP